jgi:hypothetical protein
MADQQIAVLIDYENVGLNAIQWLFDQISDMGRVTVRRAFADWSVAASQRDQLLELGIEPIHLFHSVKSGKNSSDIRLAIDAIELLYQSPVDTFGVPLLPPATGISTLIKPPGLLRQDQFEAAKPPMVCWLGACVRPWTSRA